MYLKWEKSEPNDMASDQYNKTIQLLPNNNIKNYHWLSLC